MSKWFAAICFVMLSNWPALALTPLLSGNYTTTNSEACQEITSLNSTTGQMTIVSAGFYANSIGISTFNPKTGLYNGFAFDMVMSAIYENRSVGGDLGSHIVTSTSKSNGSYSNTANTLTLDDKLVYHIFYGAVDQNNVAQNFVASLKVNENCFFIVQAIHK